MHISPEHLAQDLRQAARALRRSPGFTVVSILTLAVGIGAATALFSAIEAVLLRPLPYASPDRLVWITRPSPRMPAGQPLTPEFQAFRLESHAFSGLAAWNDAQFNLTRAGEPELLAAASVNAGFLRVLGVQPLLGRDFEESEDRPGDLRYALLSYLLWQRHFAGDAAVVGRTVVLNDRPYLVTGILPPGFRFPGNFQPDLLIPGGYSTPPDWNAKNMGLLRVIGRSRDGWNLAQVEADLTDIEQRHRQDMPAFARPMLESSRIELTALSRQLSGAVRRPLLILWGAVTMVLLLICANVAGLHLARTVARSGELSLRAALGAGQVRLVRLLLGESLMVALAGGGLGVAGAFWLVRAVRLIQSLPLPLPDAVRVNPAVLLFAAGITLLTGVLAGVAPAFAASRPNLVQAIKGSGAGTARGWSSGMRSVLVVAEVALALVLLLGAGLLLRSLQRLLSVPMGFNAERVLTLRLRLESQRYSRPEQPAAFVADLLERMQSLPGIRHSAAVNSLPLTNYNLGTALYFEGEASGGNPASANVAAAQPMSSVLAVTSDYFPTLEIPLLAGRGFDSSDQPASPPVAIVNRAFAERFYAGGNPVGRHLQVGWTSIPRPWFTIVGMVPDTHHQGPDQAAEPELYVPFAQQPARVTGLAIRSTAEPELLIAAVRREIHQIDPDLPIFDVSTMSGRLARATGPQRLELALVGFFALLATVLAVLGVYGVIAYAVSQGTREIGVRLALGAAPARVQRTVVARGLKLGLTGVALGLAAGYGLTTFLASLLYNTSAHDLVTFGIAGGVLLAMAVLASYWPARRAARVDPMTALRCE